MIGRLLLLHCLANLWQADTCQIFAFGTGASFLSQDDQLHCVKRDHGSVKAKNIEQIMHLAVAALPDKNA